MSEAARKLDAKQRGRIIRVVCYPHHKYMNLCFGYRVHVSCMYTRADANPGPESTYKCAASTKTGVRATTHTRPLVTSLHVCAIRLDLHFLFIYP
jgi:hypothetical protein